MCWTKNPASVQHTFSKSFVLLWWPSKCLIESKRKNRKITSFCHSEFKLYILSIIIPHSETIIWLTHPHTHTLRREHECTHCTLTHSNKHFHVQTYMCTWNTQIQAQWPKQVCEQLQMKEQSSSGDLKRKERERLVFFLLHPDKKCPGLSSSLSK